MTKNDREKALESINSILLDHDASIVDPSELPAKLKKVLHQLNGAQNILQDENSELKKTVTRTTQEHASTLMANNHQLINTRVLKSKTKRLLNKNAAGKAVLGVLITSYQKLKKLSLIHI